jgi:cellulose synthase/poly-beta-1,6-N-acetylglucosamine synthase-like glycosyltransferase
MVLTTTSQDEPVKVLLPSVIYYSYCNLSLTSPRILAEPRSTCARLQRRGWQTYYRLMSHFGVDT